MRRSYPRSVADYWEGLWIRKNTSITIAGPGVIAERQKHQTLTASAGMMKDLAHAAKNGTMMITQHFHGELSVNLETTNQELDKLKAENAALSERLYRISIGVPQFATVYCSQCGCDFGPANSGYSSCREHQNIG